MRFFQGHLLKSSLFRSVLAFILTLIIIGVFTISPFFIRICFWVLILSSFGRRVFQKQPGRILYLIAFLFLFATFFLLSNYNRALVFPNTIFAYSNYYFNLPLLQSAEGEKMINIVNSLFFPGKIDFTLTVVFIALSKLFGKTISRFCLDFCPNSIFEFLAFFPKTAFLKIYQFGQYFTLKVSIGFLLAATALYLLNINNSLLLALIFGLFTIVPYFGVILGGAFLLFFLPESFNIVFQLVGIIITSAVCWFIQFLIFEQKQKSLSTLVPFPTIILVLMFTYLIFGTLTLPFVMPVFFLCSIIVRTFYLSMPLLLSPFNRLRKTLTA
jgi:hypothetical protein